MVIVETSVFTRQIQKLLSNEEYRQLQIELAIRPNVGAVVRGVAGYVKYAGGYADRVNEAAYVSFIIGQLSKIGCLCS